MADPNKYKSLSVQKEDWEKLGQLALKLIEQDLKWSEDWLDFFLVQQRCKKQNGKR